MGAVAGDEATLSLYGYGGDGYGGGSYLRKGHAMMAETLVLADGEFQLRRALKTDVLAVVELLANDRLRSSEESLASEDQEPYVSAFLAIDADPAHLLCVVTDSSGSVVATMHLTFLPGLARRGATRLQIEAVRVHEKLRGKGVGSAMILWAVDEAARRGASLVQLTSDAARPRAHRFYERLGFVQSHAGFKLHLT